ncbi:MAG TPA: HDOD domain-containing protein [candidate division Zixibacteria bacterium]|nr:HDOD domain-containing protein [candidate division Zixibacteria bacterium]
MTQISAHTPTQPGAATDDQLQEIISSLGELPASPAVVSLVMNMTTDLNTDIHGLTRALSADQSLAAKVLRLSNSPFYGRTQNVKSLEEAIVILGFYTLRSLVVATGTQSLFASDDPRGLEHKLWEHSLATALAARMLAVASGHPQIEEAFLAGLLHDIGKLILLQKMPTEYRGALESAAANHDSLLSAEYARFGYTHAEIGAALCSSWSFPPELVEAVRYHHQPVTDDTDCASLSSLVFVADALALDVAESTGESTPAEPAEILKVIEFPLSLERLNTLRAELPHVFAQERALFSS